MERRPASNRFASAQDWWWIFDPRISLRARAALIFGGSAAISTVLFSWLAGTIFQRTLERQAGATFETLAFQMSDKLDRVVQQRFPELQLVASLAPFRTSAASAIDRRRMLEALQSAARDFAWIGFADTSGRVTTATHGLLEGTSVDAALWFRQGRERPYAGNLHELPALTRELANFDDERSTRFLDLALPVNAANGQFLGVLAAHLRWEWAREVQLSVIPEAARRERLGITVYSASGEVLLDSGGSGWTPPPDAPAISDSRRFRGTMRENTSNGTSYLTGFSRSRGYREFRGFGWLVTVRQPIDLALAPARELQRLIAGWGFLFAAVLVIVSWFATAPIARRLRTIGIAADRIREGDVLTVMPSPGGDGELARMCGALGEMVDELRAKQEAAEAQARENKTDIRR